MRYTACGTVLSGQESPLFVVAAEWTHSTARIPPARSCSISECTGQSTPAAFSLGRPQLIQYDTGELNPLPLSKIRQPLRHARSERRTLLHDPELSFRSRRPKVGLNEVCGLFHVPARSRISQERRCGCAFAVDKQHSLQGHSHPCRCS